jgi:hypothetical protein
VPHEIPPAYVLGFAAFGFLMFLFRTVRNYARRKAAGTPLRPVPPAGAIFIESGASGYSEKSFMTRIGGASRILLVWISPSELAIQKTFPFSVLMADYDNDLEHRLSLNRVTGVDVVGPSKARLCFTDLGGTQHTLMLRLKDPAGFKAAIKSRASAV